MGHAQTEVGSLAVLEAKHVVAHEGPASTRLPNFARIQGGEEEFLANFVHLFPDDPHDLVERTLAKEKIGINPSCQLADVAGADEELVAGDLGVGRSFAQ